MISLLDAEILALVALNLVAASLFLVFELRSLRSPRPAPVPRLRKSMKRLWRRRQDDSAVGRKARDRQVEALLEQVEQAGSGDRVESSRGTETGGSLPDAAGSGRTTSGKSLLGSLI